MASPQDPREFRRLMSRWATGVSVVTASDGPVDAGLTVNALLSVSTTPPTLLAAVGREAETEPILRRSGRFGVTFLAFDQQAISERFAQTAPSAEKFRGVSFRRGLGGVPLLNDGLATFVCRVTSTYEGGDHTLFLGLVEEAQAGRDVAPLLFFRSSYAKSGSPDTLTLAAFRPPR